jgi:hypothetical protein
LHVKVKERDTEVVIYIEALLSHAAHLLNALSGQEPRINAREILA